MKLYWVIEITKILVWVAFGIGITMMMGCRTLPDTVAECQEIFSIEQEMIDCEERVLKREDRRAQALIDQAKEEALAKKCWRERRGVWDKNNQRCTHLWRY